ncbi:MAG: hypothetical protein M5U22_18625 [Thermoleophilia bacterium]|nr:hypothetical protein [Thermoleophilia bacterium]
MQGLLAAYGAVVATFAAAWNVVRFLLEKPRLRVRLGWAWFQTRGDDGPSSRRLAVYATNLSNQQLSIHECGLFAHGEKITRQMATGPPSVNGMSHQLPHLLGPGEMFTFWFEEQILTEAEVHEPFVAYVRDSSDRYYLAKGKEAPWALFLALRRGRMRLSGSVEGTGHRLVRSAKGAGWLVTGAWNRVATRKKQLPPDE